MSDSDSSERSERKKKRKTKSKKEKSKCKNKDGGDAKIEGWMKLSKEEQELVAARKLAPQNAAFNA